MSSNKNGIVCIFHNQERRSFYIDSELNVLPCCFYASGLLSPDGDIQENTHDAVFLEECENNPGWNNLANHKLEDIVKNKIYSHHVFEKGWDSDNPSTVCLHQCGDKRITKRLVKNLIK